MTEEIIVDGVNVAECEYYTQDYQRANNIEGRYEHCKDVCELNGDNYFYCKMNKNCCYKQLKRLEQENRERSKLIRGTKDYVEVCSICKDEVTIYPNISGRTDYTQNEVECRALAQIITRKNNLEQENKELGRKAFLAEQNVRTTAATFCDKDKKIIELEQENKQMKSALEEIKNSVINYLPKENYKFAKSFNTEEFELLENIVDKINEILK